MANHMNTHFQSIYHMFMTKITSRFNIFCKIAV